MSRKKPAPAAKRVAVTPSLYPLLSGDLSTLVPDPQHAGRYRIQGKHAHRTLMDVTMVGLAKEVDLKDPSCLVLMLEDDQGKVTVQLNTSSPPQIEELQTVRVLGALKSGPNKTVQINAYHIRLADPEEWEFHKSEANFHSRLLNQPPPTKVYKPPTLAEKKEPEKKEKTEPVAKKEMIEVAVFKALEASRASDIGMTSDEIAAALPAGIPVAGAQTAIHRLLELGQIYTTIDQEHYKISQ